MAQTNHIHANVIRQAFLERVPYDGVQASLQAVKDMKRFNVAVEDLLKNIRFSPIENWRGRSSEIYFTISFTHSGKQLEVLCQAEPVPKRNQIRFWVLSIRPLS